MSPLEPPKPKKIKKSLLAHNDKRIDYYYWLRDDERKNKEVIDYLKAENRYSSKWFESQGILSNEIFNFYKRKLTNLEISFPVENDGFSYYSSISINSEYRKYYRNHKKQKKLILDLNKLAKNRKYYSISGIYPSKSSINSLW